MFVNGVHVQTRNDVTIKHLDLRYWGPHGILTYTGHDRIIEDNDFSWIGAGTSGQPLGNGIELSVSGDTIVRNNRIDRCCGAGMSTINSSTGNAQSNISFYGDVVSRCEYGFGAQTPYAADTDDVEVTDNVFYNMSDTVWHDYRDTKCMGLQSWSPHGAATNCLFNGNIVHGSVHSHVRKPVDGWACEGNRYYPDSSSMFRTYNSFSGNFAAWKAAGHDTTGSLISAVTGTDEEKIAALVERLQTTD